MIFIQKMRNYHVTAEIKMDIIILASRSVANLIDKIGEGVRSNHQGERLKDIYSSSSIRFLKKSRNPTRLQQKEALVQNRSKKSKELPQTGTKIAAVAISCC